MSKYPYIKHLDQYEHGQYCNIEYGYVSEEDGYYINYEVLGTYDFIKTENVSHMCIDVLYTTKAIRFYKYDSVLEWKKITFIPTLCVKSSISV